MARIKLLFFGSLRQKERIYLESLRIVARQTRSEHDFDMETVPTADDARKTMEHCAQLDIVQIVNETGMSKFDFATECGKLAIAIATKRLLHSPYVIIPKIEDTFIGTVFRQARLRTFEGPDHGVLHQVVLKRIEHLGQLPALLPRP